MAIIGKFLRSIISDSVREVVLEEYEGYTRQGPLVSPAGIDSVPIADDQAVMLETAGNSQSVCVGIYSGTEVNAGEIKVFSRDADGNISSSLYQKADGAAELKNDNYSIKATTAGLITITNSSGAKIEIDAAGLFAIKNNSSSLNTVLTNLITALTSGVIDPSTFVFNAATQAALTSVQTQINLLTKA